MTEPIKKKTSLSAARHRAPPTRRLPLRPRARHRGNNLTHALVRMSSEEPDPFDLLQPIPAKPAAAKAAAPAPAPGPPMNGGAAGGVGALGGGGAAPASAGGVLRDDDFARPASRGGAEAGGGAALRAAVKEMIDAAVGASRRESSPEGPTAERVPGTRRDAEVLASDARPPHPRHQI